MKSKLTGSILICAIAAALVVASASMALAQSNDPTGQDQTTEAIRLFEAGQSAHERGDLQQAIRLYESALKLKPDFAEADFQRGNALAASGLTKEAEAAFRHTLELKPDWPLAQVALGSLLRKSGRLTEAEAFLGAAIKQDATNFPALIALAELRLSGNAGAEQLRSLLGQLHAATDRPQAPAEVWSARGAVERRLGEGSAASASLEHALTLDKRNLLALLERAELRISNKGLDLALEDARRAQALQPENQDVILLLARIHALAGRRDDALKLLNSLSEPARHSAAANAIRAALVTCDGSAESRATLEASLLTDAHNAALLACLGSAYRTQDPAKSLDYYAQAAAIEPRNIDHAVGYAAALVQARRFAGAVTVLRKILTLAPENYAVHANLATALYELKSFEEALVEYRWLIERKPDAVAAYFFMATANDALGLYVDALPAYQTYLRLADPTKNQLEIDKINLRLPILRRQIAQGKGKKH